MNEKEMLNEARYFLDRMKQEDPGSPGLTHNLSAFMTAGRSVIQRMEKEAKPKGRPPKGPRPDWFDSISKDKVIKFFAEQRNISLKEITVKPAPAIDVRVGETLSITDRVSYELIKVGPDGQRVVSRGVSQSQPSIRPNPKPPDIRRTAIFTGPLVEKYLTEQTADVFELAEMYLKKLNALVKEGQDLGILTP